MPTLSGNTDANDLLVTCKTDTSLPVYVCVMRLLLPVASLKSSHYHLGPCVCVCVCVWGCSFISISVWSVCVMRCIDYVCVCIIRVMLCVMLGNHELMCVLVGSIQTHTSITCGGKKREKKKSLIFFFFLRWLKYNLI